MDRLRCSSNYIEIFLYRPAADRQPRHESAMKPVAPRRCWVVMESNLRVFKQVNFRNTGLDFEAADSESRPRAPTY